MHRDLILSDRGSAGCSMSAGRHVACVGGLHASVEREFRSRSVARKYVLGGACTMPGACTPHFLPTFSLEVMHGPLRSRFDVSGRSGSSLLAASAAGAEGAYLPSLHGSAAGRCALDRATQEVEGTSEVRMGFEPTYVGFANRCLTTWLPHQTLPFAPLNKGVKSVSEHTTRTPPNI